MKKSALVTLVLSSTLMSGCDDRSPYRRAGEAGGADVTNNTYVPGLGYYHAPYHGWFEYPYNYYRPGVGYYHGGIYSPQPYESSILSSHPSMPVTSGRTGGSGAPFGSVESSGGVTRGGFGSTGHEGFAGS